MIPSALFPYLSADQKADAFNNNGAMFGRRLGPQARLATMQRAPASFINDQMDEAAATSAALEPMFDSSRTDEELVKAQLGRGAGVIMGSPPTVMGPDGKIDYSSIKPIRGGGEELLANPKFIQLARADQAGAERVYSAITGRSMRDDFQQKAKLNAIRQKEAADTFRSMAMRGEVRNNPETNFIERRVSIPDPKDPTGQRKMDAWETMDLEGQSLYSGAYETATGMKLPASNTIMSLPYDNATKGQILARYIRNVRDGGMSVSDALRQAIKETPQRGGGGGGGSMGGGMIASNAPTMPTPDDVTAMERSGIATMQNRPTDDAAYQEWATAQAQAAPGQVKQAWTNTMMPVLNNTVGPVGNFLQGNTEANRLLENVGTGLYNLPNTLSTWMTGSPMYRWGKPTTVEELAKRKATPWTPGHPPPVRQVNGEEIRSYAPVWDPVAL